MAIEERGEARARNCVSDELPASEASATACQRNLIRAGLLAEARVADVVRPYGLSAPTFQALMIVHRSGGSLPPFKISDRMVVPRNTLTHILDVLEQQELVRRERHPHHRGMVLVELTEKGRSLIDEVLPRLHARDAEWWASFSEEERRTLVALLLRAQEALASPEAPEHGEHHRRHRQGHNDLDERDEGSRARRPHSHHVGDSAEITAASRTEEHEIDA
jgi:DNA-binding MarR family transcriptional regulator